MERVSQISWQSLLGKILDEAKIKNTFTEIIFSHFILAFLQTSVYILLMIFGWKNSVRTMSNLRYAEFNIGIINEDIGLEVDVTLDITEKYESLSDAY